MRVFVVATAALSLFVAACGGGSSEDTETDAPTASGATTATAEATPGGSLNQTTEPVEMSPTPDGTQGPITQVTTAAPPELPAGAVPITNYFLFPPAQDQSSRLITLDLIAEVPDGHDLSWYTYEDGAWTRLQGAFVIGGNAPQVQTSFSPVPSNVIVLAEPE